MDGECGTRGRNEICIENFGRKSLREETLRNDRYVDRNIVLE
jgi:hypothetical protein